MASRVKEFVPQDYDQLYKHYKPAILRWVVSAGIEPDSAEDVAHAILEKFIQHDALSDFDPDFVLDNTDQPPLFGSFLSGFVFKYVRHHRDVQTRMRREPTIMNMPTDSYNLYFGDLLAEPDYQNVEEFEAGLTLRTIRSKIAEGYTKRKVGDQLDMLLFFDTVLLQVHEQGHVVQTELADLFDVSATTIQNWLKRLRVYFDAEFAE